VTADADLRRRIDRTLDYTDSLLRLPGLNSDLALVLRAVHESLCTPAIGDPLPSHVTVPGRTLADDAAEHHRDAP
jgi:hypothetical protein